MHKSKKLWISLLVAVFLICGSGFAVALGSESIGQTFGPGSQPLNAVQLLGGTPSEASAPGGQAVNTGGQPNAGSHDKGKKAAILNQFDGELQKVDQLEIDFLSLRQYEIQKQGQIRGLMFTALTNNNVEALKHARELQKKIKPIDKAMKDLRKQIITETKEFRKDCNNGEVEAARTHINQVINLMGQNNAKFKEKLAIQDQTIQILS
ncbi:MAG: hypothetical protein ABRQ26_06330 [Syntrophomonadaceae bacterium]